MVVAQATPEHLVTRVTPEITVLLEMAELGVMPVIPVIQVAPETLAGMVRADRVVRAALTVQLRVARVAPAVQVVVLAVLELQVTQVQAQQLAHQVIPVELELPARLAIPEQVEAVLPVETPEMRGAQDRRAVRVTQAQQAQEET